MLASASPSANAAVHHHSKSSALMSQMGQLRSSEDVRRTTALTLEADLAGSRRDVSDVPGRDILAAYSITSSARASTRSDGGRNGELS
jgi:hypothetical protein